MYVYSCPINVVLIQSYNLFWLSRIIPRSGLFSLLFIEVVIVVFEVLIGYPCKNRQEIIMISTPWQKKLFDIFFLSL